MLKRCGLLVLTLVLLAACDTLQEPTRTVVLPTLAQLPTETPTPEPSPTTEVEARVPTETPTEAPTETPTDVPTPNAEQQTATAVIGLVLTREILSMTPPTATLTEPPTATPTPTLTPSATLPPTETPIPTINPFVLTRTAAIGAIQTRIALSLTPPPTATPTITPTSTPTPRPTDTPRPTNTPPPTDTPAPTPTSAEPRILSFAASQLSGVAGAAIIYTWQADADIARLETLNGAGQIIESIPVQPTGNATLLIPANAGRIITYRLVVGRAGIERSALLNVTVLCQFSFFFGDQFAPPDANCPMDFGATGAGAIQNFERGIMIYINANNRNEIYGMVNQGGLFVRRLNGWDGATLDETAPPPGLIAPRQMFNWAYYNTLAPVGTWNQAVGWGTTEIDLSQRTIQFESNMTRFYIDAPGGVVFRFTITGADFGTWVRIR
jgi:hypothetical protein